MKQHRPRVSDDNYQRVMSHLMGRFGESETFDNSLWLLLTKYENLEDGRLISNDTIRLLTKELATSADLLITESKRADKYLWASLVSAPLVASFFLAYIWTCL